MDWTGIVAHPPELRSKEIPMSWITILIIVIAVLVVLGFLGRGRFRA